MLVRELLYVIESHEQYKGLSLNHEQRAAWIDPSGQVYNLGEVGHTELTDTSIHGIPYSQQTRDELDQMDEGEIEYDDERVEDLLFTPMYKQGWVRVTMYNKELGISGTPNGIHEAWIYILAKKHNNFNNVAFDVYTPNNDPQLPVKCTKSVIFKVPEQRRELVHFAVDVLGS